MSYRFLLLSLAVMLFSVGLCCSPLLGQDVRGGDGVEYPQGFSNGASDGSVGQVPGAVTPKPPVLFGRNRVGPATPTFPYGYFGAESRYRWNSHFSTSHEYMFWRPGLRYY
jgi:hypothetical protein